MPCINHRLRGSAVFGGLGPLCDGFAHFVDDWLPDFYVVSQKWNRLRPIGEGHIER